MNKLLIIFVILISSFALGQNNDNAGVYKYGTTSENGRSGIVYIYPNSDNTLLFYLELSRGAPSYNSGAIIGKMELDSSKKENYNFVEKNEFINCNLNFRFIKDSLYIRSNNKADDCGYGYGVHSDGDFKRIKKGKPDYFIDRSGDKIWFKDLN